MIESVSDVYNYVLSAITAGILGAALVAGFDILFRLFFSLLKHIYRSK